MTNKKYDITCRVGTYEKNGEQKGRYINVGALMEKDGKPFILLNKTFNPAGVPSERESIILSLFEPKKKDESHAEGTTPVNSPEDITWTE